MDGRIRPGVYAADERELQLQDLLALLEGC